ncbi:MAG: phosphoenolpyruvate carboxykinase (ATP) [Planctomycetota bacterium]|nr:MAG: phosphoenolpyruvate carboxykinase (ATP) [Planctomycetota bacterium]
MIKLTSSLKILSNPSQQQLKELALQIPYVVIQTYHQNLNRITRNKARMAQYTYILDKPENQHLYSSKVLDPKIAQNYIQLQQNYIQNVGTLIQIDGYLGLGPKAVPTRWLYTPEAANIAGMQQLLAFPRKAVENPQQLQQPFQPKFHILYTPDCFPQDLPGQQAILVDLKNWTTYIMGPDYFGESKKAALRMLNEYVYQQGGLVLHAGAKAVKVGKKFFTVTILGLSGTGKTTTTFSKQGELTQPIQDDMVCLWPKGNCTITENGCFAKTFGLTPNTEPILYQGCLKPTAWLENVFLDEQQKPDFSKQLLSPKEVEQYKKIFLANKENPQHLHDYIQGKISPQEILDENGIPKDGWDFVVWTQNGRAVIPLSEIPNAANLQNIPPVQSMGILNRDEGPDAATPAIVQFSSPEQAAGYFMLGETSKTSAAGKERGRTRSPFTQPFFPSAFGLQAKRFSQLLKTMENVQTWMMNTGYIGGGQKEVEEGTALKITIQHSSSILEAMFREEIQWCTDPNFGYLVVDVQHPANQPLLKLVPPEILQPYLFFKKHHRLHQYQQWVKQIQKERQEFLEKFQVDPLIIQAVVQPS